MKKKFLLSSILVLAFLFAPISGTAEQVYQYRDQSGALHYTDDRSNVSENAGSSEIEKFDAAKTEKAAKSSPSRSSRQKQAAGNRSSHPETEKETDNNKSGATNGASAAGDVSPEQLDREKERLDRKFEALQAEKDKLSSVSIEEMTRRQLNTHEQKLKELNARIEEYREEKRAFKEKVNAYNSRLETEKPADQE